MLADERVERACVLLLFPHAPRADGCLRIPATSAPRNGALFATYFDRLSVGSGYSEAAARGQPGRWPTRRIGDATRAVPMGQDLTIFRHALNIDSLGIGVATKMWRPASS